MTHNITLFATNLPIGSIIMFSGDPKTLPNSWKICDGVSHKGPDGTRVFTPDLRGRFVVGAGGGRYTLGNTGGEESVTLTAEQMPEHNHYGGASPVTGGAISEFPRVSGHADWDWTKMIIPADGVDGSKLSLSPPLKSAGGDQPHENRPPFHALYYIMRVW